MQQYESFKILLNNIPGTNDACERVLGMVSDIEKRTTTPKSAEELRNVIKVTRTLIELKLGRKPRKILL